MRSRHIAVLLTCLSVIAAACGPSDVADPTATTEDAKESTTCELTTTESGPDPIEDNHVAYLSDYIVVPIDQREETLDRLSKDGINTEEVAIDLILGEEGTGDDDVEAARSALSGMIQVFAVSANGDDVDPLVVAGDIRAQNPELRIAPIHALGESGHIGFKAGTDPESVVGDIGAPRDADENAPLAAVVDSGIYPETPGLAGNVEFTPIDIEPLSNQHSHGTFVASIIRQLSPKHRIAFARARTVPLSDFTWSDGSPGNTGLTALTTELHVGEAILRIMHRHQREAVDSLNLSLGAYSPLLERDIAMTSLLMALDLWFGTFEKSRVFAAGGNDPVADPFWPGALDSVVAVGALNDPPGATPSEIVWHDSDGDGKSEEILWADVTSNPRGWIDELAPGSLLVNYSQPETLACWSGSSFASAVANGLHLSNETPASMSRGDVPRLTYWDGNQIQPAP